jgi:hypothetical protein
LPPVLFSGDTERVSVSLKTERESNCPVMIILLYMDHFGLANQARQTRGGNAAALPQPRGASYQKGCHP